MTTKYILQRYNKDIESSQEIGSGEGNTSNYSKDVPTQELTPPIKYLNEGTDSSYSKGILKFLRLTKDLNVKQIARKSSRFKKKKKILRDSGLNGKYWQFDNSWNRFSASFVSANNNRVTRLQRNVWVSYILNR